MNELQVRSESLPAMIAERASKNPLHYPAVRTHDKQEIFQVVLMALAKSYTDLGREQPSIEDKTYMANELTRTIPSRFPSIRLHEIPIAFAQGIRGKFGTYYGLSIVAFENFIEAYLAGPEREEFAKELKPIDEPSEPSEEEKFQLSMGIAMDAFNRRQNGLDISLMAVAVYDFLDKVGLIVYTMEEKFDLIAEAKSVLLDKLSGKKHITLDRFKRIDIDRRLKSIQDGTDKASIINQAKRIGLDQYLAECILNDIDLQQEIINNKLNYFKHAHKNVRTQ